MPKSRSLAFGLEALGRREFWTFRAIHAIAGGLLTILGAGETVFVNEHIRMDISTIDARITAANDRLAAIDRALFQFRFAQTNAITLGVLSANDSLKPQFRQNMVELMFVTRRLPTEVMLQQIYPDDLASFNKYRKIYEDLIETAKKATSQDDWTAVNAFEFDRESQLFNIEQQTLVARDDLVATRRAAQDRLDFAVVLGFALQQIGFVIVLLAGLVRQHHERQNEAAPATPAPAPS